MNTPPAMCRDDHAEVHYGYDAEGLRLREAETCPVCDARFLTAAREAVITAARALRGAWQACADDGEEAAELIVAVQHLNALEATNV